MDSLLLTTGNKHYDSSFGKPSVAKPETGYSTIKILLVMTRDTDCLFWKIFSGMYMAFLMAYVCFYIHSDSINLRFILSIGALLAVIGNKYIIEPSLPDSLTYTLVDTLHGITMIFILLTIACTAYYFKLVKKGSSRKASLFDFLAAQLLLIIYVILNFYYLSQAQINV